MLDQPPLVRMQENQSHVNMNPEKEHAQIPYKVITREKKKQQNTILIGNNCAHIVKTKMHHTDSPSSKGLAAPADGSAGGGQASAV